MNLIGNTPLVRLGEKLYAKLETYNPSGSIKDRMAYFILKRAQERGELEGKNTIVVASSGNTGISFAMLAAMEKYSCIIVMPRNMSKERKEMIRAYGARIVEVGDNDFEEAIRRRDEMVANFDSYWTPKQFSNLDNIKCHQTTTAKEIGYEVLKTAKQRLSALVAGAGTGGTIMGCQKHLKSLWSDMQTVLVMPSENAQEHGIQGINDGADFLVDRDKIDDEISITTDEAKKRARRLATEDGLLVGISSGANVLAAEKWIKANNPSGVVVTFLCDRGERYFSCC